MKLHWCLFAAIALIPLLADGADWSLSEFSPDEGKYQLAMSEAPPAMFSVNDSPMALAPPVESLQTPRLKVYVAEHCGPCEAWKRDVLPRLKAAGWEVGTNIEIVEAGSIPAPRFEWVTSEGVVSTLNGYKTREAFNAWHRVAVNGPIQISAGVCKCGENCPCRVQAYSKPRTDRKLPDDFVFGGMVEPTSVFTEYPEPQGVLDPAYQVSYESPQVVQQVAYQSGNCASGMCGPAQAVQSYGYQMGNCASGQCGPMQAMPAQQHAQGYWTPPARSHSQGMRRGPVRRIVGGLFGGLFGGFCR